MSKYEAVSQLPTSKVSTDATIGTVPLKSAGFRDSLDSEVDREELWSQGDGGGGGRSRLLWWLSL